MKINEIFSALDEVAPLKLSHDFQKMIDGYDNSGILASVDGDIKGIVFALDLTDACVEFAIKNGCNLIVTHHPAIYAPIKSIDGALRKCLNSGIGIVSMHLNVDCAKEGIDYHLAKALGGDNQKIVFDLDCGCGYGRVFDVDATINDIKNNYINIFKTENVMVFGDRDKKIKKIASFCGSGLDVKEIELASEADLYISSDIKHHVILYALERGKCVLCVSHYSSEVFGFKKYFENVKEKLNDTNCVFFENAQML